MNPAFKAYEAAATLDQSSRDELVLSMLPEVKYIARRIHERLPQSVLLEDLIQAGVMGLLDAAGKYDSSKNVPFKVYAKFRIRGTIIDSLRDLDWSPRSLRRQARHMEVVISQLQAQLGRDPNDTEIAGGLHMTLDDYHKAVSEIRGLDLGSFYSEGEGNVDEDELDTYIPYAPEDDPFFQCSRSEMKQLLADAISHLPERERQILALYYYEELTMREIGAVMGVVESRVSQIHSGALLKLRSRLQNKLAIANNAAVSAAGAGGTSCKRR
jgi:RNA polymerase sigma factor for flagellar operon FliA